MAVLDDVKILKNIADTNRDNEINIYIRRATTLIGNYLNLDSNATDIENTYQDACIAYVMEQLSKKGNEGIKQYSQGSESGTYGSELSENVKALLPVPYARMMG
ncbi:phage head-tail connector protein [Clostridium guangxiense]|uniref:phage head-tail connector protein n=1 Tax=Clostridium guangxiense TaxID=1662055 RepID=UPI001E5CBE91|nr:phage head-tail connector protein [Clostridium guangxiense]MCD2345812.1 phage head-tail connector protein [Clostridium guangxiense]